MQTNQMAIFRFKDKCAIGNGNCTNRRPRPGHILPIYAYIECDYIVLITHSVVSLTPPWVALQYA